MYEGTPDLNNLRQGDVIRDFCFPRYSIADLRLLHSVEPDGSTKFDNRAILKSEHRFAVVLSQCCEFNEGKRNAFTLGFVARLNELLRPRPEVWGFNLAELVPFQKSSSRQSTVDQIRKANTLDLTSGETKAVNVYLLEPDGQHLEEPHIVDFSRVISVRMKDRASVLRLKILQMKDECRRQFQEKLAYFYGRRAT